MAPDVAAAAEKGKDQRKLQQQRRRTASQQAPAHNGGITTNADGSGSMPFRMETPSVISVKLG